MADQQPRRSFWRNFLLWIVGPLVVLGVPIVYLALNPPKTELLELAAEQLKIRTGYDLSFGEGSTFTVWPTPSLDLRNVKVGRPQRVGARVAGLMADAKRLRATLDMTSLLQGDISVTRLELEAPAVTLLDQDLRAFRRIGDRGGKQGHAFRIEEVVIRDGVGNYVIGGPNPEISFSVESATLGDVTSRKIGKFEGKVLWRGEKIDFGGSVEQQAGGKSTLSLGMKTRFVTAVFDGDVLASEEPAAKGTVKVAAQSLADLLLWLNIDPGARTDAVAGPASIAGPMELSADLVRMIDTRVETASGTGVASLDLDTRGIRPRLSGKVDWERLDLSEVVSGQSRSAMTISARSNATKIGLFEALDDVQSFLAEGLPPSATRPDAIESGELSSAQPRSGKPTWSTREIDLSGLRWGDIDVTQRAKSLVINDMEFSDVAVTTVNEDGRLTIDVKKAKIGNGSIAGKATLNAQTGPVDAALSGRANRVRAESLLQYLTGRDDLHGKASFEFDLSSQGRNLDQMINKLAGRARVVVADGKLIGYDLKRVYNAWWRKWRYSRNRSTPFKRVSASLRLGKGIVRTVGAATMRGAVEIDSTGWVSLRRRTVDQRVRLRLAPPPGSLQLPVRLSGAWNKLKPSFDLGIFSLSPRYYAIPKVDRDALGPAVAASARAARGDAGDEILPEEWASARRLASELLVLSRRTRTAVRTETRDQGKQRILREKLREALENLAQP